ncbi:MAG: FumA C-terminus/TtdB family hydratase beta subunit [Candidatus Freyarchaeota archaeon]
MSTVILKTPVSERDARRLRVGDLVYVEGTVHSWRDMAFSRALRLLEKGEELPVGLEGAVHWHCGPITRRVEGRWQVVSAGSTTSLRFTSQEARAIREWGVRLVVGKGGMGRETARAMSERGAAYLETVGGAASLYAKKIVEVAEVHWLDLGMPEAVWVYRVQDFGPLLVTIDSHGNNLHEELAQRINQNRQKLLEKL